MKPILSILVPTFNRAHYLERLLAELELQIQRCHQNGDVEVAIGDNASDDNTGQVLSGFATRNKSWIIFHNEMNVGPDANILNLLKHTRGKFRWVIGDDDLPTPGLLSYILDFISLFSPSLVYLPSIWSPDIYTLSTDSAMGYDHQYLSPLIAARELNIRTTFLSSWIFNADQLFNGISTIDQIASGQGTSFIQLGWILPLFASPQASIYKISKPCILATSGNTGGYSILSTFLANYPSLVNLYAWRRPRMQRALIGNAVRSYMPSLILSVKSGKLISARSESFSVAIKSIKFLWSYPSFWILCLPALLAPKSLIIPLKLLAKPMKALLRWPAPTI